MNDDTQADETVRCADEMHQIYQGGVWWRTIAAAAVILGSIGISSMADADWVIPVGVVFAIAVFVVPHVVKIHRGYARQLCPSCGKEAGRYVTKSSCTYLVCKHCGKKTPTDCGIDYESGPPVKLD